MLVAHDYCEPYGGILALLVDCYGVDHGRAYAQQYKGATYRQLAAIGYASGMSKNERVRWYEIAEELGVSSSHAAHMLGKLKSQREEAESSKL